MLLGLMAFCTFHNITEGAVRLGCDNSSCVRHGQGDWQKVSSSIKHSDLIRAIRLLKHKLPITVSFEHVYGHQDDYLSFACLPRLSQLNILADHRAKSHLQMLACQSPPPQCSAFLPYEGWRCSVDDIKITSDPGAAIRRAVFSSKLCKHLVDKQRISRPAFQDIDWHAMETATTLFPPLYRLWVSKHVSGFFGIGTMMLNWNFWDHSRCPCCQHVREDKLHLMTCPQADCAEAWHQSLLGLETWMIENDTDPDICASLILTLDTRDPSHSFTHFSNPRTLHVAQAQDRIGWIHTTEGKISSHWAVLQAAYYRSINSPRSVRKWAAGLVTNLLTVTHTQWMHRCSVLHERDTQGLKLQEGRELLASMQQQFSLGIDGLHARDHHYIRRGWDCILALPAANKKAWLASVLIAHQIYMDSEAAELQGMQLLMQQWLANG
jgi:hypothetical protein